MCIVTPVYNGAEYLDASLLSLVSQAGSFRLRLHVQDGGSTDGTIEKIQEWDRRIQRRDLPCLCDGIEFTWNSSTDNGMYDAINKAFQTIGVEDDDILGWLNADDLLLPGAIQFARDRMTQMPDVNWITGPHCEADAAGVLRKIHAIPSYSKELLRAGLHDLLHVPLVMQEGSFWRGWLWLGVDGVRADLRLAGDFDLWRRFAKLTHLHSCEQVLAAHRRRPGQLSGEIDRYFEEIRTSVLTEHDVEESVRTWSDFQKWLSGSHADGAFAGYVIVYLPHTDTWEVERRLPVLHLRPALFVRPDGSCQEMVPCTLGEGFSAEDGPYPHLGLVTKIRFAPPGESRASLSIEERGSFFVLIHYRNFTPGLGLEVHAAGRQRTKMAVPPTEHERNGLIAFQMVFPKGFNELLFKVEAPADTPTPGLMVLRIELLSSTALFS